MLRSKLADINKACSILARLRYLLQLRERDAATDSSQFAIWHINLIIHISNRTPPGPHAARRRLASSPVELTASAKLRAATLATVGRSAAAEEVLGTAVTVCGALASHAAAATAVDADAQSAGRRRRRRR